MFVQLNDVKNLKISEGNTKEISFQCTIYDDLLNIDRNISMTIPKAILNAKLITEKQESSKEPIKGMTQRYTFVSQKLRLDFDLLATKDQTTGYYENHYYKAKEITN
jgi:hypothetical protein